MMSLPETLCTKQDYFNAVRRAKASGEGAELLKAKLQAMKETTCMMSLKAESWSKRAETQHQEDYEPVPDPNCEMNRLGFRAEEIDMLIGELADV